MARLKAFLLASIALVAAAAPARAEPFSLAIAAAIFNAGIATSVGAAITIGTVIAYSGAAIALSAGQSLLNRALNKQSSPTAQSSGTDLAALNVEQRTGVGDREMVLGEVQKKGLLVFEDIQGPYLYRMWVVAAHACEGVVGVKVNGTLVELDPNGFPIGAPFYDGTKYFLRVVSRNGADNQDMCPIMAADWPTLERSFRQQGLTCVTAKMYRGSTSDEAAKIWGQNDPQLSFIVRGKKFFDPRDATQVAGDATTYKWTRNAALCRAGWDHDREGQGMLWSDEDVEALKVAADVCDQMVPRLDGTLEPRYTCDGVIDTTADPSNVLQDLTLNMLGTFIGTPDKIAYLAGGVREAETTLTTDSARGDLEATSGRFWNDVINTVRTTFSAANDDYNVTDGPVYQVAAYLAEDGEEKSISIALPFTKSETQLQRICKYLIELSRLGRTIRRGEDISALTLLPGEIHRFAYDGGLSVMSGDYMLTRIVDTERLDEFQIEAQEYDGLKLFGWVPANDEQSWAKSSAA